MRSRERIVVDRSVADDLCARLTSRASSVVVGDPREPWTQIGARINAAAVQRVAALVEDTRDEVPRFSAEARPMAFASR
jgi:vanillin dehydrogenase